MVAKEKGMLELSKLTWQSVPAEPGTVVKGQIEICPQCIGELEAGVTLEVTSADEWPYCALCGRYGGSEEKWPRAEVVARVIDSDPCDCGDRVMHHNGGHYHYASLELLHVALVEEPEEAKALEGVKAPEEESDDPDIEGLIQQALAKIQAL